MKTFARRVVVASALGLVLVCSASELGGLASGPAMQGDEMLTREALSPVVTASFQDLPPAASTGAWELLFHGGWR